MNPIAAEGVGPPNTASFAGGLDGADPLENRDHRRPSSFLTSTSWSAMQAWFAIYIKQFVVDNFIIFPINEMRIWNYEIISYRMASIRQTN